MKKYHTIGQAAQTIKTMRKNYDWALRGEYLFTDEKTGEPVFGPSNVKPDPLVTFRGTIKNHGSNMGIRFKIEDGKLIDALAQSRNRVLGRDGGHFGFVDKLHCIWLKDDEFVDYVLAFGKEHDLQDFTVFGEAAGRGIQKGVGVAGLEKFFYVFDIYDNVKEEYLPLEVKKQFKFHKYRIVNAQEFESYTVVLYLDDMEKTQKQLDQMNALTADVEKECPITTHMLELFGEERPKCMTGEGIVWESLDGKHRFKTKGDKHSRGGKGGGSKKATIDPVLAKDIKTWVERTCNMDRINQAFEVRKELTGKDELEMKDMGELIRWIVTDILKEESDTLPPLPPEFDMKPIRTELSNYSRKIFMNKLQTL
jgi:hypothetical protein